MNKTTVTAVTLAVCGAAITPTATADEISGVYIQGDLGVTHLKATTMQKDRDLIDTLGNSYTETGLTPRIGGGYDFGDWRLAGDYTHYPKLSTKSAKVRAHSLGVSAIYDVDTGTAIQPYIGARLSVNKIKSEFKGDTEYVSHDKTQVSPGVVAGVGYKVDRNLALDAGYRYNHMDSHLKSHEFTVGVRYTFR